VGRNALTIREQGNTRLGFAALAFHPQRNLDVWIGCKGALSSEQTVPTPGALGEEQQYQIFLQLQGTWETNL